MNQVGISPETGIQTERAALAAHCRRVDALAVEVARRLRWSEARQTALREVAQSHHVCFPDPVFLDRLMTGVWGAPDQPGPRTAARVEAAETARLVELSCLFVERWEYSHFDAVTFDQVLEEMSWLAADGFFDESHVLALSRVPSASFSQLQQIIHRMPVFPRAALEAVRISSDPFASAARLEEIVCSDPTLAGELLKTANSPVFSPAAPIRSIRQAALFVGMQTCCRILAAVAMRPVFRANPALEDLWRHSVDIARYAESIARLSGRVPPEEAFLAGLIHDAGRLAIAGLPTNLVKRQKELTEQEVEQVFIELLQCGFDHAAVGAEVARQWLLPPDFVDAIEFHHQPERSSTPLACVLYLAEYWSGSQEDLPSLPRLRFSLDHLGLKPQDTTLLSAYTSPEMRTLV